MKQILAMFAVMFIAAVAISSCSKADMEVQDKMQSEKYVIDDPKTYGAIEGTVSPFIKGTYVYASNMFFQTQPVMIAENGTFRIELNSGVYDLYVVYEINAIPNISVIPGVAVKPLTTTNLGVISIE